MKLLNKLKTNRKIHYIGKFFKHIGNKKYVDFYLNMETNPRLLLFEKNGMKNQDKAIYVITENGNGWGYFAEFRAMLCKLLYADRMGFYPYIYWGNSFLYVDENKKNEIPNAFEYFFRQLNGITLEEVQESYMVAYSKSAEAVMIEREFRKEESYAISDDLLRQLGKIYNKYISLNLEVEKKLKEEYCALLGQGKILGVHFRGTDYKKGYDIHPVFVQVQDVIDVVSGLFVKGEYEKIFLATDESVAVEEFEKKFGKDKVFFYQDTFRGNTDISVAFSKSEREFHKYKLGYEVIRDMWTLAQCDGLVSGLSQVSSCARIVKESQGKQYIDLKIIDRGINHNNNKFSVDM